VEGKGFSNKIKREVGISSHLHAGKSRKVQSPRNRKREGAGEKMSSRKRSRKDRMHLEGMLWCVRSRHPGEVWKGRGGGPVKVFAKGWRGGGASLSRGELRHSERVRKGVRSCSKKKKKK